jgi:4-methylaminobutanoate oxidase (formaldehyde-forming)
VKADVAVIGAGALGLSTALHLGLQGRSVVVIERWHAGSQASGRAAGLFKSVQADEFRTEVARNSIRKVISFEEWTGIPLDVCHSGSVMIARTNKHKAILKAELDRSRSWGVDLREPPPLELAGLLSYYDPSGEEAAIWCAEDVYIEEPATLVEAYVRACQRHGVDILEGEPVVTMAAPGGHVVALETAKRKIETNVVVDAGGAWASAVAALAGTSLPVAPVRHQLLITEPLADVRSSDPITRVIDAAIYLRPARGGLMLGAFEGAPLPLDPRLLPSSFHTDDVPLDLDVLRRAGELIEREAPRACQGAVAELRGGLFTMTPDGRFLLGPVPGVSGLWVASGCNGSGFSSSPALGEMLASWITRGEAPGGAEQFSPARLGPTADEALIEKGVWQYAHYYDTAPSAILGSAAAGPHRRT